MAKWSTNNILLTLTGREVLSKVQAGVGKLEVSRIVTGSGRVSPAQLYNQTKVSQEQQTTLITKVDTSSAGSSIEIQVSNNDIEEAYDLNQIGIYVTHADYPNEVLYLIAQCDEPDTIPLPTETPTVLNYSLFMTHSGVSEVTIEVNPAGLVTTEQLSDHIYARNLHLPQDAVDGQILRYNGSTDTVVWDLEDRVEVVDNLKSDEGNKALSAKQGKALKEEITTIVTDLGETGNEFEEHIGSILDGEKHGIRINSSTNELEYFNGEEWVTVSAGGEVVRDNPDLPLSVQVSATPPPAVEGRIYFNTVDKLFYVAKSDQWYRMFVGGDEKLEREAPNSPPVLVSKTDTTITLQADEDMEFRYQGGNWQEEAMFGGLQRNETYHFEQRYKSDEVYKASPASPSLSVTTDRGTQTAPAKPTLSNIEFDRVTVTGASNTEVRLGTSGDWYNSPHTFTGLTEETSYTAYARKKETITHQASPASPGSEFTTPSEAKVYGFEIDEANTNPKTAVTYIDMAEGMTPMLGNSYGSWQEFVEDLVTPILLKNGVYQYELNKNDYTKKANGSNSVITGTDGDVMIRIKHIYAKEEKVGSKRRVWLSTKMFEGATALTAQTEGGYNQKSWGILRALQHLFLLLYKDRNSQTALGRGYVDGNSVYANTGGANTKGLFFGETTGKQQMKFLGIEDFWGNKLQWIDGIVSDANRDLLVGYESFNDAGTGYKKITTNIGENTAGYYHTTQGGEGGYVLADKVGSETTGYTDYGYLNASCVAHFGGSRSNGSNAGAFYVRLVNAASHASADRSARLCFVDEDYFYVGAYLGFVESNKLRSISGKEPTGNLTISAFRTHAKNNN